MKKKYPRNIFFLQYVKHSPLARYITVYEKIYGNIFIVTPIDEWWCWRSNLFILEWFTHRNVCQLNAVSKIEFISEIIGCCWIFLEKFNLRMQNWLKLCCSRCFENHNYYSISLSSFQWNIVHSFISIFCRNPETSNN